MDFTLYWFMFPVSILVATCAMLSGIGGAARRLAQETGCRVTGLDLSEAYIFDGTGAAFPPEQFRESIQ